MTADTAPELRNELPSFVFGQSLTTISKSDDPSLGRGFNCRVNGSPCHIYLRITGDPSYTGRETQLTFIVKGGANVSYTFLESEKSTTVKRSDINLRNIIPEDEWITHPSSEIVILAYKSQHPKAERLYYNESDGGDIDLRKSATPYPLAFLRRRTQINRMAEYSKLEGEKKDELRDFDENEAIKMWLHHFQDWIHALRTGKPISENQE